MENIGNKKIGTTSPDSIMKYFWPIAIAVAACFAIGFMASFFQSKSIVSWYPYLIKPAITPPDIVFPIAWSIIYLCMGISIGLLWYAPNKIFAKIMRLFLLQMFFNFMWSICFFTMQSPILGMAIIIALDISVILYTLQVNKVKKASAWLFAPYLAWLALATYLNGYIMIANW